MKKGFTLAEILIVISVIGVLSAILMPMAFHSAPDENVLKFRKANATFGSMIHEMTTSDKYFYEGDLGRNYKNTTYGKTYICKVMADILTVKKEACSDVRQNSYYAVKTYSSGADVTATAKTNLDSYCKSAYAGVGSEIETTDGVVWYQGSPYHDFDIVDTSVSPSKRYFAAPNDTSPKYPDADNFDANYKVFCIDVDGTGPEAPFGYGVRADGKILRGKRAEDWIKKSIQRGDD